MGDTEVSSIPQSLQTYYTTYAAFPTVGVKVGSLAYATDTLMLYRWDGAAWQPITSSVKTNTGTYTGNDGANRAIAHGVGLAPKFVYIIETTGGTYSYSGVILTDGYIQFRDSTGASAALAVTDPTATNFYVGNATSYRNSMNAAGFGYRWFAIG